MNPSGPADDHERTTHGWYDGCGEKGVDSDPMVGARVGMFLLKELLGEGGMGRVYLAEQIEPVRRSVAVKLLQESLVDARHVARFGIEQPALARMSHPAIAQVFHAGTTDDGRPYFAMELVPGDSITEFCDRKRLGLDERLALFARACWGVQHAHQKGIIHRDLKPTNVLVREVDGQPSPKIIDFGIATAARAEDDHVAPRGHGISGTPAYMSPEQASPDGSDVDTRTDVFSLGAVLYELLTGTAPVDSERLSKTPRDGLHEMLLATVVEPPSRRLERDDGGERVLAETPGERRRIAARMGSEIDWIVLKALAHDRAQRYDSVAALAQDVEAYLTGDRVQAVPPTLGYRLACFARRNKPFLAAGAAITLALVAGLAAATWGLVEARQQRDRALQAEAGARLEAAKAERIAGFSQEMLSGVDPAIAGALDKTLVRRILEGASDKITSELSDQPEVAAAIHHTLGATYSALGEYDPAVEHLTAARDLWQQELGPDERETLLTLVELALIYRRQGRYDEAEVVLRDTVAGLRKTLGDDHQETLTAITNLASLHLWQGSLEEAEVLYLEALERSRRTLGPDHRDTLTAANNLALLYFEQGRLDEAEPLYVEVLERSRQVLGEDHPDTINSLNNLAALMDELGRYEEGERIYREAIEGGRRVLGADHPETLNMMNNLAVLYRNQGRLIEAADLHLEVLEACRRVLGPDHPDTLNSLSNVGSVQHLLGQTRDAARILGEAAEAARRALPEDSILAGAIFSNYGAVLTEIGRYAAAEAELLKGRDILHRTLGPDHRLSLKATARLEELAELRQR